MLDTHLIIGEVLRPQGVRGEVKVRPITCDPDRFADTDYVFLKRRDQFEKRNVCVNRIADDAIYMKFEGVDDRNAAELLRGEMLYIDREHAVQLDEDEEFICDLIGCEGVDTDGRSLGKLTDVMQPGGNDVYVFNGPLGEMLVPALNRVVLKVDVASKSMLLDAKVLSEVAVFDED